MVEIYTEGILRREEYKERTDIKRVIIRNVQEIPEDCFSGCINLETVVLGADVDYIGPGAFEKCSSLKEVIVEDGVKSKCYIVVGPYAFQYCSNLEDTGFFSKIKKFDVYSFSGCKKLGKISIPAGTEGIWASSFWGTGTTDFYIDPHNKNYYIHDGFLIQRYEHKKKRKFKAIKYLGKAEKCTIPKEVTAISNMCFKDCPAEESLTDVYFPAGLLNLEDSVYNNDHFYFEDTILGDDEIVNIPETITQEVSDVFESCIKLASFHVSKGSTMLATMKGVLYSKDYSKLIKVPPAYEGKFVVPETVRVISDRAFSGCRKCSEVVLHRNIDMIGFAAFADSSIVHITAPSDGRYFIYNNGLYERDNSPKVKEEWVSLLFFNRDAALAELIDEPCCIREYAFQKCDKIKRFNPATLQKEGHIIDIHEFAFKDCSSLKEFIFPDKVGIVPSNCFENCTSLEKLVLSDCIKILCREILGGCKQQVRIVLDTKEKNIYQSDNAFYRFDGEAIIDIRSEEFDAQRYLPYWINHCRYSVSGGAKKKYWASKGHLFIKDYDDTVKLLRAPSDIVSFNNREFRKRIIEIVHDAFDECTNLRSVYLSNKITYISRYMFGDNRKLQFIRVPQCAIMVYDKYEYDVDESEWVNPDNMRGLLEDYDDIKCFVIGETAYSVECEQEE